jgi:L-2,4-diaminobutyrate decarboxylase
MLDSSVSLASTSFQPLLNWDSFFLSNSPSGIANYEEAIASASQVLTTWMQQQTQAYSGLDPAVLRAQLIAIDCCPEQGQPLTSILQQVSETVVAHAVSVSHPHCIAHLHCPPLTASLAAEVLLSATNQSMDSWDQSPAATMVEQQIVDWLCQLYGYSPVADGTFTSGGTQSNLMGLLLARDHYAQQHFNWLIQQQGLPSEASRFRIICSDVSHFTVRQSAAMLGLGQQSVVTVETNCDYQMEGSAVEACILQLRTQNLIPIAIVATVGTTDFGSIDALTELAACAQKYQLWLHADAAFGGALILSDRHRHQLDGIAAADSITVDFHKLFYQPISCGAFLLKNRDHFDLLRLHADYLNPEGNEDQGIPDLVTKSIQTTRRFDALKLWVSLQTLGRKTLATMIETTIDLAAQVALLIESDPDFLLAAVPAINAVVFRYAPSSVASEQLDEINQAIRMQLIQAGFAIIAQTKVGDRVYLKFTLLNPCTTYSHMEEILSRIKLIGQMLESSHAH